MDYQTFEPSTPLNSFVKCYWTLHAPKENTREKQRIVPDGCMEMIFHYGDLYKQYDTNGKHIIQPRCFVFGQITTTLEIEPTGDTRIFAVRFQPDGFTPFSSLPLKAIENRAVPLHEFFSEEAEELEIKIVNAPTTTHRIQLVESFLMERLVSPQAIDRIINSSVKTILDSKGKLSVTALTEATTITRRQLERRFSTIIGLSPKQLAKIIRLQSAITLMLNNDFENLTSLAYDSDYFDQAHFIKDFKEFTGVSPTKFYAGQLKMSTLFAK
ncbi:MAG: AraC family transcriptional regulator [Chitinophagaceae bacterium]|nr:MAG: AraC family transcriptional regulator [Chitinophagaceae bacterium]